MFAEPRGSLQVKALQSVSLLFVLGACSASVAIAEPPRLDPFQLLVYRDAAGSVRPVQSADDWEQRRAEIAEAMQEVAGPLPGADRRVALAMQIEEEADAGTYVRQLITYASDPGTRTPAYLCFPKDVLAGGRRAAAVLCLHPTDDTVGHKVAVGLGGRAGRQYAAELAERGYVTLAPAYPHLAGYRPDLEQFGYQSGTMKAIWDNIRGLDLLATLPQVDTSRGFGAIGHSLGGHNAIFTAVLEPRISVVVSSCGFDSFRDYYGGAEKNWHPGKGWCQIRYMPRLAEYRNRLHEVPFDFPELLAALAPRRVFISAPLHDANFDWRSVDRCVDAARRVYQLLDADAHLVVRHPDCPHDFPDEARREAYEAIDAVLRP